MITNLSLQNSLVGEWMSELRSVEVQADRWRFRTNLERVAEVAGYEISKTLNYKNVLIQTPLGEHQSRVLADQPVIGTILRAGIPMHNGLLHFFDRADNAFIAAYRKHHRDGSFEIAENYLTCPPIEGRVVILADPMLATGASLLVSLENLLEIGVPSKIHIVCAIACTEGINNIIRKHPKIDIWAGDIDEELTAKRYIVPGLGDAGDLAFGSKHQY